jgi:putative transposase
VFSSENSRNSAKVVEKAIREYGKPKQFMTDHGSSFTAQEREGYAKPGPTEFQKCLIKHEIKHIKARVKHPQSNGKVKRAFQSIYKYKLHFGTWRKAVGYYNFRRPHMSLENGRLRTPYKAFLDKMRKAKNN